MPPPTPSQILEQTRSHYLMRLRQAIEDHASSGILQMVSEAALRGPDGKLLRRGDPLAPVRVDLVTLLNDEVHDGLTIESETMPGFAPFSLRWKHQLPINISPFPWNACPVRFSGATENLAPVLEWFDHWFDEAENKAPGDDGLRGVVHSIVKTPAQPGMTRLLIDLGSAPLEAFEELVDAIHAVATDSVEIGAVAPATA
jgi:hypothetical protein